MMAWLWSALAAWVAWDLSTLARRGRPGAGVKHPHRTPPTPVAPSRRPPPPVIDPGEARLLRDLLAASPEDDTDCAVPGTYGVWITARDQRLERQRQRIQARTTGWGARWMTYVGPNDEAAIHWLLAMTVPLPRRSEA